MKFLYWLERTSIAEWVQSSDWGMPILLCFHAVGMGLFVGLVLVIGARVFGYPKGLAINGLRRLMPVTWLGFTLNFCSGVLLFMANATGLIVNWTFQLKMASIVAGGWALWLMWRAIPEDLSVGDDQITVKAKILAGVTVALWITAVFSGRYIAYTLQAALLGL